MATAAVLVTGTAAADPAPPPSVEIMLPAPDSTDVAANASIWLRPTNFGASELEWQLTRDDDGTTVELRAIERIGIVLQLEPAEPLSPGSGYRFRTEIVGVDAPAEPVKTLVFSAGPPAPAPTTPVLNGIAVDYEGRDGGIDVYRLLFDVTAADAALLVAQVNGQSHSYLEAAAPSVIFRTSSVTRACYRVSSLSAGGLESASFSSQTCVELESAAGCATGGTAGVMGALAVLLAAAARRRP
jgi:hypothetical protein